MEVHNYTIVYRPEPEGGYTVWAPRLEGCVSYGETKEIARQNIKEAIELFIESLENDGNHSWLIIVLML